MLFMLALNLTYTCISKYFVIQTTNHALKSDWINLLLTQLSQINTGVLNKTPNTHAWGPHLKRKHIIHFSVTLQATRRICHGASLVPPTVKVCVCILIINLLHIDTWTKWRTCCKSYVHMHFADRKCCILIKRYQSSHYLMFVNGLGQTENTSFPRAGQMLPRLCNDTKCCLISSLVICI